METQHKSKRKDGRSFDAIRWHRHTYLSKYIFNTSTLWKIKSSSTLVILLPSSQGLSFTFMLSHHPFFEHFFESIAVVLSVMCLSQSTINWGITMMLLSLISLYLVFTWTSEVPWHLCFALQIKASEIPFCHILLRTLLSCWCLEISCYELLVRWYFSLGNMIAKFYSPYIMQLLKTWS